MGFLGKFLGIFEGESLFLDEKRGLTNVIIVKFYVYCPN
jgi:hypothetical protein